MIPFLLTIVLNKFVHPRWLAGFLPSTVPPIRWEFPTSTGELVVINSEAAKRRKTGIPPGWCKKNTANKDLPKDLVSG